jgi:cytochrome c oxidase subunit 2
VPADTPVTFRATSADVIHGFLITGTNVNSMLEPGYIATFRTRFAQPGEHLMPCHEFCGFGHQGMWAKVKVVDRDSFFKNADNERRQSCVH